MTDVIEAVEAEIIGENDGLSVSFSPALIKANFETLRKQIEEKVSIYKGIKIDVEDAKQVKMAKDARAALNGIAKDLAARRVAIKREYMNPYTAFEAQAKDIEAIAKDEADMLGEQITEGEKLVKDKKREHLQDYYSDFAPILVPNVPYGRIHEDSWLLKGTKVSKAEGELEAKVSKIAADWESLKQLDLVFYDVCEVRFFESLDLGAAVSYNAKLVADRQKIENMKQEIDSKVIEQAPASPVPCPQPTEPQEEPKHAPAAPIVASPSIQEEKRPYVMLLDAATLGQIKEAGRLLGSVGITGTFRAGTLDEVYARTRQMASQVMSYAV